ncbi:LOW QUALITY PROTEIN: G-protein coupled receptor 84-like [Halichoeres trimaculatus]|uniref:LOW QUALITY PROTEIN: G-protein coupled receptor 84-like n=1 Tax=Halichoeres trimaculatus TaxID=147232 RepID=UPI003D9F5D6C
MLMNHSSQTGDDLFSCYSPSVVGYRYFAVLLGCAVTITGTLGNLMTILAFTLDPRLRTRFNALIINLAVADLLYCTVLQPISVDSYLHLRWRSGRLSCSVFGLLLFLSNSVSIVTLCLIASCRYLLVTKRAVFDRVFSNCGLGSLLIFAWALGLASFGPLWSVYDFVPKVCTCSFHRTKGRPYTTILLVLYFVFGLGFVGTFCILIYRHVRVASKALLRYRVSRQSSRKKPTASLQGTDGSGVVNTCSFEQSSYMEQAPKNEAVICEQQTQGSASNQSFPGIVFTVSSTPAPKATPVTHFTASRSDKEMKYVTHMCLAIFLCFTFCFVPFFLLNIADRLNSAPQIVYMVCSNLTWLNSCINPVLYAVMNRQFQQAHRILLNRAAALCPWTLGQAQGSEPTQ